jgi:hypothetical protein
MRIATVIIARAPASVSRLAVATYVDWFMNHVGNHTAQRASTAMGCPVTTAAVAQSVVRHYFPKLPRW